MNRAHESEVHDIERETLVITTEDGVVLTGTRADAFEARVTGSIRKPFYSISFVILVIFVLVLGLSLLITRLSTTINHVDATVGHVDRTIQHIDQTATRTDDAVAAVTGPEAQAKQVEAQKKVINDLLQGMDCQNQRALQRVITALKNSGVVSTSASLVIVEPKCQTPEGASNP